MVIVAGKKRSRVMGCDGGGSLVVLWPGEDLEFFKHFSTSHHHFDGWYKSHLQIARSTVWHWVTQIGLGMS